MVNSKEILERFGISRATLSNYIRFGLLPKPEIRSGSAAGIKSPRLGFFPQSAIDQLELIKTCRGQGMSMDEIIKQYAVTNRETDVNNLCSTSQSTDDKALIDSKMNSFETNQTHRVTLENSQSPVFMINNRLELVWWNDASSEQLMPGCGELPGELEERGVLPVLLNGIGARVGSDARDQLIRAILSAVKSRLSQSTLLTLLGSADFQQRTYLENMILNTDAAQREVVLSHPIDFCLEDRHFDQIFVSLFREGFLISLTEQNHSSEIDSILAHRQQVVSQLARYSKPHITLMSVLVADLQGSVAICAELPANEYFELINDIWRQADPIFRKYHGSYGKHAGDGMLYYFLPQPDTNYILNSIACALEIQQLMKNISAQWQRKKGWFNELHMNIGLHEGREWFGAFQAGPNVSYTVLGDTVNQASRISDFARSGAILASKSLVSELSSSLRRKLHYGVRRVDNTGASRVVSQSFATPGSLNTEESPISSKFKEIEMLPITEIFSLDQ